MKYSIDTSALIHGWVRAYPKDVFPTLWDKLDSLISDGHLRASEEVKVELGQKEDELLAWAGNREDLFVEFDESLQKEATLIQKRHPNLVDPNKTVQDADPFVIALAKIEGCTVVTQEVKSNNPNKPKIPDVCESFRIPHINLLQLIKQEGWIF